MFTAEQPETGRRDREEEGLRRTVVTGPQTGFTCHTVSLSPLCEISPRFTGSQVQFSAAD